MWLDLLLGASGAWLGFAAGALITVHSERSDWFGGWWKHRHRRTTLRRANLPVLGPPILLGGLALALAGDGSEGALLIGVGLGGTIAPLLMAVLHPLKPLCPSTFRIRVNYDMVRRTDRHFSEPIARCAYVEGHPGKHNSAADGSGLWWPKP